MVILTIILVQVLCCHLITKITRKWCHGHFKSGGAHAEAVQILNNRQRSVVRSTVARVGDSTGMALSRELPEMRAR